eukprot:TRINITY_DN5156_c0_g1_i2.p1 TRINITY_DN5156_c0_g1~~TRINITY_DN5156_c0_g1_i2.p1  ORF type:complete len:155 (+),score=10.17 TRINITY_DN5156_c0_g1_i2:123-587(+)
MDHPPMHATQKHETHAATFRVQGEDCRADASSCMKHVIHKLCTLRIGQGPSSICRVKEQRLSSVDRSLLDVLLGIQRICYESSRVATRPALVFIMHGECSFRDRWLLIITILFMPPLQLLLGDFIAYPWSKAQQPQCTRGSSQGVRKFKLKQRR